MTDGTSDSSASTNRPRTRQRAYKQPAPLPIPHIDDDAAERKRVLNVLAQRRYRERKRQNRLKANSGDAKTNTEAEASQSSSGPPTQEPSPSSSTDISAGDVVDVVVTAADTALPIMPALAVSPGFIAGFNMELSSLESLGDVNFPILPQPLTPNTSDEETVSQQQDFTNGLGLPDDFALNIDPSSLMTYIAPLADSYNLPVIQLAVAKAMMRIADRLGCTDATWDLDCVSPFNQGLGTPAEQLPAAWRPTPSQIMIPHHPILDFLPWPRVRDKIINLLTLPEGMRPTVAKGPMALVNFAYDVEDTAEGVRIYGEDPCEPGSWEVGQVLFERWWFVFDRDVIADSNKWRRLRGAPPLRLKGQTMCSN